MSAEYERIHRQLRDFLVEQLGEEFVEIDADTPLLELGILTSLTVQGLLAFIEDEYRVSLPPEEVRPESFATLRDIADLIIVTKESDLGGGALDGFEVVNRLMESHGLKRNWLDLAAGCHHMLASEGDTPTLVFLPGLGIPASSFGLLMRSLNGRRAGIALDLAGFGVSEPNADGDHGFPSHVRNTLEIIERCHAAPCVLVGSSAGAMIAAEISRQRPDICIALVVISFGRIENPETWWRELKAVGRRPEDFWQRAFFDPPHLNRGLRDQLRSTINSPAYRQFLDPKTLKSLDRTFEGIQVPTMFIGGENDRIIDASVIEGGARQVAGARLEWLPRCGHYAQSERSEEVLVYIEHFLGQVLESSTLSGPR